MSRSKSICFAPSSMLGTLFSQSSSYFPCLGLVSERKFAFLSPISCCVEHRSHFYLFFISFSYALGRNYPQQTDQSVANNGKNVDK